MAIPPQDLHIAVLGCGFMGTAILQGLLKKIPPKSTPEIKCTACVRSAESLQRLKNALGEYQQRATCNIDKFLEAASQADVVMLGVPPNQLDALLGIQGMSEALRDKTIISVLAGTLCDQILDALTTSGRNDTSTNNSFHILRVNPTIGASNNDSVTSIAKTKHAGEYHQKLCQWLFDQIGSTHHLPENLMDAAIAVGAACHALAFTAIDAVADASVAEGLPRDIALQVATQSLRSAAGLLATNMTPESLKGAMSIPRSITMNSALELERGHVRPGVSDAVRHAIRYARSFNE